MIPVRPELLRAIAAVLLPPLEHSRREAPARVAAAPAPRLPPPETLPPWVVRRFRSKPQNRSRGLR